MSAMLNGKREWTPRISVEKTKFDKASDMGRALKVEALKAVKCGDFEKVANILNLNGLVDETDTSGPAGITETTYTLERGKEVRRTTSHDAANTMAKNGWDISDVEDNII